MYHSITFGDKNTWDDWHIVPTSRPFFNPPELKTKTLDIPGGDGVIDLTEALTGYPVYENRTGSLEFVVMNQFCQPIDSVDEWYDIYSDIMDYLHGQKMIAVLEDDPTYYYEGRFTVSEWQSGSYYSVITIDYDVSPYKWRLYNTLGKWLANPFEVSTSDVEDVYSEFTMSGSTANTLYFTVRAPVCPVITVSGTTGGVVMNVYDTINDVRYHDLVTLYDGTTQLSDLILVNYTGYFRFRQTTSTDASVVSVEFREGRL